MLCDQSLWQHLRHTEKMLITRVRAWPWKLFQMLRDESSIPDLVREASAHSCMLDDFATNFFQGYPSVGQKPRSTALSTDQKSSSEGSHSLGSPTCLSSTLVILVGASETIHDLLKIGIPFEPCLNSMVAFPGFSSIVPDTTISSGFLSLHVSGCVAGDGWSRKELSTGSLHLFSFWITDLERLSSPFPCSSR